MFERGGIKGGNAGLSLSMLSDDEVRLELDGVKVVVGEPPECIRVLSEWAIADVESPSVIASGTMKTPAVMMVVVVVVVVVMGLASTSSLLLVNCNYGILWRDMVELYRAMVEMW